MRKAGAWYMAGSSSASPDSFLKACPEWKGQRCECHAGGSPQSTDSSSRCALLSCVPGCAPAPLGAVAGMGMEAPGQVEKLTPSGREEHCGK